MKTILYVPAEGDPFGFLSHGVLGARVPWMRQFCCETHGWGRWFPECNWSKPHCHGVGPTIEANDRTGCFKCVTHRDALVLAHNGAPVAEGMDRAARVLAKVEGVADLYVQFDYVFGGWAVGGTQTTYYVGREEQTERGPLARMKPSLIPALANITDPAHALALVLAARCGGEVVVLP